MIFCLLDHYLKQNVLKLFSPLDPGTAGKEYIYPISGTKPIYPLVYLSIPPYSPK